MPAGTGGDPTAQRSEHRRQCRTTPQRHTTTRRVRATVEPGRRRASPPPRHGFGRGRVDLHASTASSATRP